MLLPLGWRQVLRPGICAGCVASCRWPGRAGCWVPFFNDFASVQSFKNVLEEFSIHLTMHQFLPNTTCT